MNDKDLIPSPGKGVTSSDLFDLVRRCGRQRIEARKDYKKRCLSDKSMRRSLMKKFLPGMTFERPRFPVGSVVEATMWPGLYLVVDHGFTGSHGQERGCYGCKITDRIHKKPHWIGPDKTLKRVRPNPNLSNAPRDGGKTP